MKTARHCVVGVLLWAFVIASCGGGGGGESGETDDGAPAIPQVGEPAYGVAGHVLISDRATTSDEVVDQMWVGFDDPADWNRLLLLVERLPPTSLPWVGGRLVADATQPLGFYFDPATTSSGELTASGIQNRLDILKADPQRAEETQNFGRWVVPATVERLVAVE